MPRLSRPRTVALVLSGLLLLAGCKLIDQRTFAPAPDATPPAAPRSTETRTPLISVAPGTKLATYQALLRSAVRAAQARDPAVRFDVVSVVPASGTLAEQIQAADALRASAAEVAQTLIAAGVAEGRISLGARPDPTVHNPEVRVYLR
ncbi:MAG TPA: hypothetical protein VJ779_05160 [Acetobacteraceae bacterium]|nr:hypothetical protein [Acetobacteraceae bacterium]